MGLVDVSFAYVVLLIRHVVNAEVCRVVVMRMLSFAVGYLSIVRAAAAFIRARAPRRQTPGGGGGVNGVSRRLHQAGRRLLCQGRSDPDAGRPCSRPKVPCRRRRRRITLKT